MARMHAFALAALVGIAAAIPAAPAAAKGGPSPDPSVAVYVEQVPTASGSAVAKEPTPPPSSGTAAPAVAAPVTPPPTTTTTAAPVEPVAKPKPKPAAKPHRLAPPSAGVEAHAVLPVSIWRKLAKKAGNDAGTLESLVASAGLQTRTPGIQPGPSGGGVSLDTIVLIAVLCSITAAAIVVRVRTERSRSRVTRWDAGVDAPRRP